MNVPRDPYEVPAIALAVAVTAVMENLGNADGREKAEALAWDAIDAAAPHIRAAERERIAAMIGNQAERIPDHAHPGEGTRWTAVTVAGRIQDTYRHAAWLIRQQP